MCAPVTGIIELIPKKCILCLSYSGRFVSASRADGAFVLDRSPYGAVSGM